VAVAVVLESVSVTLGTKVVLDDVTLGLDTTQRIGVVGRNGAGKSTLLRLLAGTYPPDGGRRVAAGGLTCGLLVQNPQRSERTIAEQVMGDSDDHDFWGDARVRDVMAGLLGANATGQLSATLNTLSGGERRRVELAALLVEDPDLLLLDEPTNHLDVEAVAWLADYLVRRRRAVVVITHDRWFLDAVCTDTWEVAAGRVHQYEGGYAAYVLARAERDRAAAAREDRRRNTLRKELAWLRRGPPARTSKPKFRIEAANALIDDEPAPRDTLELKRVATARLGKQVLELTEVELAPAPTVAPVLVGQTLLLGPADRLGLLGPNGVGKTTLLKLLAGEGDVDLRSGRLKRGSTVKVGVLGQQLAGFDPTVRVGDWLAEVGSHLLVTDGRELTGGQLLESFGFSGAAVSTPLGDLSGGELRRLHLLRLMLSGVNVLLLDEPSNDLDVETLAELEDVLDSWPGTLLVISHDRYFLERTTDRIYAMLGDQRIRDLPGGVEEYLRLRSESVARGAAGDPPLRPAESRSTSATGGSRAHAARKEMASLERRIAAADTEIGALSEQMAEAATDPVVLQQLHLRFDEVTANRTQLEDQWLELAEES
jgi:ATP-binding cassette subfamily F protein uup